MEKWFVKNKKADFAKIQEEFRVSEVAARVMVNRGITEHEQIEEYLNPDISNMLDGHLMKDMEKGTDLIKEMVVGRKQIRVIGDYDVDGIMSTYILYKTLRSCRAYVDYEIPDRVKDGYGMSRDMIDAAAADGIDVIITCDNGISAKEEVAYAKTLGIAVVITDHHDVPFMERDGQKIPVLPEADAVINPKQEDCPYPFKHLCGAGVAYKFAQVLREKFGHNKKRIEKMLLYVCIATVCDIMELTGENRMIVKSGMERLRDTSNPGLCALYDVSGIDRRQLNMYHLGFVLGPCLNASGRLQSAKTGLKLLLAEEPEEAAKVAAELFELNEQRKNMTMDAVTRAIDNVESGEKKNDKVLVLYIEACHESLAGIVAGRIREKYHKPVIVLTRGEQGLKGSGRSIEAYNMYEELTKCSHLLTAFGGHPMAAGMSLSPLNLGNLRKELNENTTLTEEDFIPKVSIDIVLPLAYVCGSLVDELEKLEPFGKGNEKPIFAEKNLRIDRFSIVGKRKNVLRLQVTNEYGKSMEAVYFGDIPTVFEYIETKFGYREREKLEKGYENRVRLSVTYYPVVNVYNGYRNVQIVIQNYQ